MSRKIPLGTALAVLFVVMAATIAITMKVSMSVYNNLISDLSSRSAMYDDVAEIDEVVREDYYGTIDSDSVNSALVGGYVDGLGDPASFYLTAEQYVVYNNKLLGKMSGTGLTCSFNAGSGRLYVTAVAKNSPAATAGIVVGDEITKVADINVTDSNYEELLSELEGEKLSSVNVTYVHNETEATIYLVMGYSVAAVTYRTIGDVGFITINGFYENAVVQFEEAIDALKSEGAKSLIIDLRNCSEGNVEYATEVLDVLVPVATEGTGAMATAIDKEGKTVKTYPSDSDSVTLPMLVLVNGGTSGPAELFACDLRDFGMAELIGTQTKGICTLQEIKRLSNGGAVVLTIAEIKPYKSESFNGVGLTPDYVISLTGEQTAQIGIMSDTDDPHIQKALELLSSD